MMHPGMVNEGFQLRRRIFEPSFLTLIEGRMAKDPALCIGFCMSHPLVRVVAREIVGDELGRTGEEQVNVNPEGPIYNQWHFDTPWEALAGPNEIIPLYRFAVYFRDYTTHSGGLMVRPGSHVGALDKAVALRPHVVQSAPGDLVIWNLRTHHAADADNGVFPRATPRNAIFFDYGTPGPEMDRYKKWRIEQKAARAAREEAALAKEDAPT